MKAISTYQLFDPSDITKGLPAKAPGNYIFLLRPDVMLPTEMMAEQPEFTTLEFQGVEYRVLYTGVTGKTLYNRVCETHLTGNNAGRSTLRKSLGCLWGYKLVPRGKKPDSTKTKYCERDENAITKWMMQNLLVLFVPNSNYKNEESELINSFNPPLNLDKNHNAINLHYRTMIKALRNRPVGV